MPVELILCQTCSSTKLKWQIKYVKYVCENCGAEHQIPNGFLLDDQDGLLEPEELTEELEKETEQTETPKIVTLEHQPKPIGVLQSPFAYFLEVAFATLYAIALIICLIISANLWTVSIITGIYLFLFGLVTNMNSTDTEKDPTIPLLLFILGLFITIYAGLMFGFLPYYNYLTGIIGALCGICIGVLAFAAGVMFNPTTPNH